MHVLNILWVVFGIGLMLVLTKYRRFRHIRCISNAS